MKKIFIIDDDPAIREVFQLIFDPVHYEITRFPDGNIILKTDFELPHLIILDKQLSGVSGLDICRFLKKNPRTKNVPVIMLSASPSILSEAPKAGADAALEKPFSVDSLREMVSELLPS